MRNDFLPAGPECPEDGRPLQEALWPEEPASEPHKQNPHWDELPLSYRLWPDRAWPPEQLPRLPPGPAIQSEYDRLFSEYYQREKDNWD